MTKYRGTGSKVVVDGLAVAAGRLVVSTSIVSRGIETVSTTGGVSVVTAGGASSRIPVGNNEEVTSLSGSDNSNNSISSLGEGELFNRDEIETELSTGLGPAVVINVVSLSEVAVLLGLSKLVT